MTVNRHKGGEVLLGSSSNIGFGVTSTSREALNKWAASIKPCSHTIKETEEYLLSLYDAVQLEADNVQLSNFELNVIMNQPEHKPAPVIDTTDAEIERYMDESASRSEKIREEIRNSSSKRFGIDVRGYYLPHTQRNESIYDDIQKEQQARQFRIIYGRKKVEKENSNIYIFFEETTETINASAGLDLLRKLLIYQGVTQKDIDELTTRFIQYIGLLQGIGKSPYNIDKY